jgi:UDP-N-acetyl-D-glucosamine/UDP-N-acetyl-D-galactosamine dehydrogenase
VGLPLAVAFAEKYPTIGFDIDAERVKQLQKGHDRTLEVNDEELKNVLVSTSVELDQKRQGLWFQTP